MGSIGKFAALHQMNAPLGGGASGHRPAQSVFAYSCLCSLFCVRLFCHLCGREFGTASLPIHIPQCISKWNARQQVLPRHLQKPPPDPPSVPLPDSPANVRTMEAYNQAAWAISQQALNDCPFCHRRFNPGLFPCTSMPNLRCQDALAGHLESCPQRDGQDPFSPSGKPTGPAARPKMLV